MLQQNDYRCRESKLFPVVMSWRPDDNSTVHELKLQMLNGNLPFHYSVCQDSVKPHLSMIRYTMTQSKLTTPSFGMPGLGQNSPLNHSVCQDSVKTHYSIIRYAMALSKLTTPSFGMPWLSQNSPFHDSVYHGSVKTHRSMIPYSMTQSKLTVPWFGIQNDLVTTRHHVPCTLVYHDSRATWLSNNNGHKHDWTAQIVYLIVLDSEAGSKCTSHTRI